MFTGTKARVEDIHARAATAVADAHTAAVHAATSLRTTADAFSLAFSLVAAVSLVALSLAVYALVRRTDAHA